MGVKNLFKFIQKYAPNSIDYIKINKLYNKKIGIDANHFIHKLTMAIRFKKDIKNSNIVVTHIYSLMNILIYFKNNNIKAIFVFDNVTPDIKKKTMSIRKKICEANEKKYMYKQISYEEISDCKNLIKIFGFPIIESKCEADNQLVYLLSNKFIDYIISDDLDILVFGGTKIIKNFTISEKNNMILLNLNSILNESELSKKQFIELSILLGNDYTHQQTLSFNKAYKLIIEYGNIKNIIENTDELNNYNLSESNDVIKYYQNPPVNKNIKIKFNKTNLIDLKDFLLSFGYTIDYIDKLF
jgi:5'-3' exonuclease